MGNDFEREVIERLTKVEIEISHNSQTLKTLTGALITIVIGMIGTIIKIALSS